VLRGDQGNFQTILYAYAKKLKKSLGLTAVQGKVFDVSGKDSYQPGGPYAGKQQTNAFKSLSNPIAVFAGHDASRALGLGSTKLEDILPEWSDLPDEKKKVLNDWMVYFSKRYNIVGVVEGATNL
jgi:hypothetical protein